MSLANTITVGLVSPAARRRRSIAGSSLSYGDGADRGDLIARIVEPIRQGEYDFVIASRARGEREPGSMAWHQLLAGHLAGIGMRVL